MFVIFFILYAPSFIVAALTLLFEVPANDNKGTKMSLICISEEKNTFLIICKPDAYDHLDE